MVTQLRRPIQDEGDRTRVQVLRWEGFQAMFLSAHRSGEHVCLVGATGGGKSTLGVELAKCIGSRNDNLYPMVLLITKPHDRTISRLPKEQWPRIREWPPAYGEEHCIVWPRNMPASERGVRQARVFGPLLDQLEQEGNQGVMIDECASFERPQPKGMGLSPTMEQLWSEGRSGGLTLIGGTQRPRHVTLLMWSQPSWMMIFTPEDELDLKRVAEASGRKDEVREIVPRLGGHEFLCVRRQRGGGRGLYVSKVDRQRTT